MTELRLPSRAIAIAILAAGLAGCVSSKPADQVAVAPPMEGEWIGEDGIAASTLRAGQFTSRFAQTGEQLIQGTYTVRDARTIDLTYRSLKRNQETTATCLLVDMNRMNCRDAAGTAFVLLRRNPAAA